MRLLLTCLCLALPSLAAAQPVPFLARVTGVQEGEGLNIRKGPATSAEEIGELRFDARDVEVMALDETGRWARINTGEEGGWVHMGYLEPTYVINGNSFTDIRSCSGTEPFWSLDLSDPATGLYSTPNTYDDAAGDNPGTAMERLISNETFGSPGTWALALRNGDMTLTGHVQRNTCYDGMTGRMYGLSFSGFEQTPEGIAPRTGCCLLAPLMDPAETASR